MYVIALYFEISFFKVPMTDWLYVAIQNISKGRERHQNIMFTYRIPVEDEKGNKRRSSHSEYQWRKRGAPKDDVHIQNTCGGREGHQKMMFTFRIPVEEERGTKR
ncbi:hypothetical protein PoB_007294800 [Plakobranchus ocellatus]|uniref:Uncharacterized protein n=1 Tax=Plakobranchus ocellatus TaxID=259542 RepID=A0AAV4DQ48_9GAST|nr:hypothetical protein PoB_007294800 [Plakobranchus ocellatus]